MLKTLLSVFMLCQLIAVLKSSSTQDELDILTQKNKDVTRPRYTTVIDILSDNIQKFKTILNLIREADEINYLNEINSTGFTILLPNDKYFKENNETTLEHFDIDKLIIFDEVWT